jgi:alcohol dehydrogenase
LIPQLILSNSRIIKASSGFDCISQSIESLISIKSNKTSVNYASKSLKIALNHYLNFLKKPNDLNSFKMSLAANLSGKAINISKTTAPHAISYPFTSFFKVPHGHAVSLTLNDFLKFNYFNLEKSKTNFSLKRRFELIFAIAKVKSINDLDLLLKNIKKEAKLESNFDKLGINIKSNFTKVIEGVNKRRLINNPVKVTNIDIKSILLKVK